MARIRSIKPEFFSHEGMAMCSPHARLLAIALTQLADAKGRIRYIEMQVHAHAFPWEASVNIPALLGELEGIQYLKQYQIEGKRYLWIVNFDKHQRLTGKEAQAESYLPEYKEEYQWEAPGCFPGKHPDAQEQGNRGTGEQGKDILSHSGEWDETEPRSESGPNDYTEGFEEAWAILPTRAGSNPKRAAFKAWRARLKAGRTEAEMISGAQRYQRFSAATNKTGTEFVMQGSRFFGPDEPFLETWAVGPKTTPPGKAGVVERNDDEFLTFLAGEKETVDG